jgi:integrase
MPLTLTHRANSSFWWITGTVNGRRIRESTGTDRRELAEEMRAKFETETYRAAVYGERAVPRTFAEVADSYLEHGGPHAAPTLARARRIIVALGAKIAADDVDQARLDKVCSALLRPNPAPATRLREVIAPARAILTHGARRRMCTMPVFDAGRASPSRTEWLTPAEVDRLAAASARHLQPLIVFLAATGARLGEALSLDWSDVDTAHARAVLRDTKNGTDRPVDLCPRALAALAVDARAPKKRSGDRPSRVFLTYKSEPYAEKLVQGGGQIKSAFATAVAGAGITKPITPHGLRHTWATWHYAEHRDAMLLRHVGGWSTVTLVERYAHLAPPSMAAHVTAWRAAGTLLTQ